LLHTVSIVGLTESAAVPVLILEEKKHIQTNKRMNYMKYESKIVKKLDVALIG